jgi:hypothetical protein
MRLTLCLASLLFANCATTNETAMVECGPGECGPKPATQTISPDELALRKRGAFDLHCDEAKLRVVPFDVRTYGVEGCDQRTTYTNTCTDRSFQDPFDKGYCTWVQSATRTNEGAAAATTK